MPGGRRKYTPQQKADAMLALMVSAHEDDGEWCPMYRSVGRELDIPSPTLVRWWKGRDREGDGALRTEALRVREKVREDSAGEWLRERVEEMRQGIAWITSAEHQDTTTDGEYRIRPDQLARAYKDISDVVKGLDSLITTGGNADHHKRLERLRRGVRRVGLDKGTK